jgi:glutamate N-acetyltransferase/amino-acid N-acetyltransferase
MLRLEPVEGIRLSSAWAGIRAEERDDVAILEVQPGSTCAAMFTRNAFCAAPVRVAREHLAQAAPRYLLVNSGNANAGTGRQGIADARASCEALAARVQCRSDEVLPFSTGVVGERLPLERLCAAIPPALYALSADGWERAARAIMTTDTCPKGVSHRFHSQGQDFVVTGIAKGAGMIRPDMATMLAFLGTDAAVDQAALQRCLRLAVEKTFNRITVDGDMSTNDACVLVATGTAPGPPLQGSGSEALHCAVQHVCSLLARAVIRDAEGATKFVTVQVTGGHSESECLQVGYAIAHSPLVKTAFFAGDPNWGRILAAVGYCGLAELDVDKVSIQLDDCLVVENGSRAASYTDERGRRIMQHPQFTVRVDLGRGSHQAVIWTSDLSHEYVRINAEYRS